MKEISEIIKYSDLVNLLEKIQNSKDIRQKENCLKKFIENFNKIKQESHLTGSDSTFYCVLRILLPNTDGRTYGIKTTTMGKIYVKILGLAPNGEDAKKLTYKNENQSYEGDFANIAFNVLKSRPNNGSNFSLKQLHDLLDVIVNNNRQVVESELTKFFEIATAMEQKWFIRILFKRLHLGIGEQKIFSIYNNKARPLYMKLTNLYKVCDIIESGKHFDLDKVEVELFQHIKAMLCQKIQPTKFKQIFEQSAFYYLETKMDGERFQIHMKNGTFKYLSRNGIDYTKNFESIILDGEMMVWSKTKQSFCVKGENYDVKHLKSGGDLNPCFVVFDILYLNNESFLEKPYFERIRKIHEILKVQKGILQLCHKDKVNSLEEFIEKFNEAMNANEEGIVLKHPSSIYKPGIRGDGWYKLKPDYVDDVIADLCFIIMGVTFDRSKNYINSYLLGALNKNEEEPCASKIYSVATVNSGLSNVEKEQLNNRIKEHLVKEKPENFVIGKLEADSWLPLKNTVLLDVTATELSKSEDFKTDFTLRFPRILSIRTDKVWLESTSIQELCNETEENERVKKIYKRNLDAKDFAPAKKIKLLLENPYKSNFIPDNVQRLSSIFENFEFCVLSGSVDGKYSIEDLKKIVVQHGGKVVENPTVRKSCICIAGKMGFRAKKISETGQHNIIKYSWLIDNFSNRSNIKFCRPKPRDIIFATEETESKQVKYFDKYGDSYTDHVDNKELKILFDDIENPPLLSYNEIENLKTELDSCWLKNKLI
ncbi:DNA ligase 4 isoform X2 [Condylostylus longicornis]|uniref:DNA ligase 4 isoform X2 n=1 Tax=Condylostylus longicornis TaxID=2530218 RepID=UPI00244DBABE|nr:DNA ligase 4 isoform X2 [Condylostylus longicornis]